MWVRIPPGAFMKYQLKMGVWTWPVPFDTEQQALEEASRQFRQLFSAHRYYLSEPYRWKCWGGVHHVTYKIIDREAEAIVPGFSRIGFWISEHQPEGNASGDAELSYPDSPAGLHASAACAKTAVRG
jgi:hypothetical protein